MTPEQELSRIRGWNAFAVFAIDVEPHLRWLQEECRYLHKRIEEGHQIWFDKGRVDGVMAYILSGVPPAPILEVVGNYEPCRKKASFSPAS